MEVLTSTKGKKQLAYEGYIYVFQKKLASGTDSYECQRRRNYGCKARIKVLDGKIVDAINAHVHAPAMNNVEVMELSERQLNPKRLLNKSYHPQW